MKKYVLILMSFLTLQCTQAQVKQKENNKIFGIVKLLSSGRIPLKGVQVFALGSNEIHTDEKGYFELRFQHKKRGDVIQRIEFSLDGYLLVNEDKVKNVVIPNDPEAIVFVVVMAKKDEYRKRKAEYYNTIVSNANTNYNRELKKLQHKIEALSVNDKERNILLEKIKKLEDEKEDLLSRAENLARQLVKVDQDYASQIAQEAYTAFDNGEIEKAIEILDDKTLEDNLAYAKKEKKEAEIRIQKSREAFDQSVENYMIKARFCVSNLDFEEAKKNFTKAAFENLKNYSNVSECISFYFNQKFYTEGLVLANQALPYHSYFSDQAYFLH